MIREWVAYEAEENSYQHRPRGIPVRLEVLHDIPVVAPVVDESKLEYRRVNAATWEDVLVNKFLPDRYMFPKELFCLLEVLCRINAKGFEGHLLVVQSLSQNTGDFTSCNGDFSAFLESSK